jgi:hypothetical protein
MKIDPIKQYVTLRRQLLSEKSSIQSRLRQINEALGATSAAMSAPVKSTTPGRGNGRGSLSVKQAVIQAASKKPLTKQQILAELNRLGVAIHSNDPMNYLNTILYGRNPKFNKVDGKFGIL